MRKKIFVFLGATGSTHMTVKLDESHAHALSIEGARPSAYGLGKSGWVTVPLRAKGVTAALLRLDRGELQDRRSEAPARELDPSP